MQKFSEIGHLLFLKIIRSVPTFCNSLSDSLTEKGIAKTIWHELYRACKHQLSMQSSSQLAEISQEHATIFDFVYSNFSRFL